uniref:Putative secreted protein n=1 Tax=Anopheles darlingi TaxID=43151 RepID=A0A2M4D663_ANODA
MDRALLLPPLVLSFHTIVSGFLSPRLHQRQWRKGILTPQQAAPGESLPGNYNDSNDRTEPTDTRKVWCVPYAWLDPGLLSSFAAVIR